MRRTTGIGLSERNSRGTSARRWLRFALAIGVAACTARAARPAASPPPRPAPAAAAGDWPRARPAGSQVRVTRREARIIFALDTARPAEADRDSAFVAYAWGLSLESTQGPRSIALHVWLPGSGRGTRWLEALVDSGVACISAPGMVLSCEPPQVLASLRAGRVVLVLRDSAAISRLFGLRPARVRAWHGYPGQPVLTRPDSVAVEYAEPQLAIPDSAFVAAAREGQRRYEAAVNRLSRDLETEGPGALSDGRLWLQRGDSVALRVGEWHCRYDECQGSRNVGTGYWWVGDSSVARIRLGRRDPRLPGRPEAWLVALRVGRTPLGVDSLHSALDQLPTERPLPTWLRYLLVVSPPAAHLRITPRPRRLVPGSAVDFRAIVVDSAGTPIPGAPARIISSGPPYQTSRPGNARLHFPEPGRVAVTATWRGLTDTLWIDVVAPSTVPH